MPVQESIPEPVTVGPRLDLVVDPLEAIVGLLIPAPEIHVLAFDIVVDPVSEQHGARGLKLALGWQHHVPDADLDQRIDEYGLPIAAFRLVDPGAPIVRDAVLELLLQ